MLTPENLRELVKADATHPDRTPEARRGALEEAVRGLPGNADASDVVATALVGLASDDRNMRVAMLRVLSLYPDKAATEGVLGRLGDPKRRVREMAMKSLGPLHLGSSRVIEALRVIAADESETNRLRRTAFFVLSSAAASETLPDLTRETLTELMGSRYRMPILLRLCQWVDQTPQTRALLHGYVDTGTKEEAVMATRALCGFLLVRVDANLDNETRQRLRETCDPGPDVYHGVPFCWVPRETVIELLDTNARFGSRYRRMRR